MQFVKTLCIIKLSEKSERNVKIAGNGRNDFLGGACYVFCLSCIMGWENMPDGNSEQKKNDYINKYIYVYVDRLCRA